MIDSFGCNQPKSLSGIETDAYQNHSFLHRVAINLNPYQGLKPGSPGRESCTKHRHTVAINLNPYQGLKRLKVDSAPVSGCPVAINLNPYQGLKNFHRPEPANNSEKPQSN